MADFPALPLWTDAYMLDCGHLSDAEHGRYFLLLMLIWRTPGCHIPNEPEWIARKLKRSVEAYHSDIAPLVAEFCVTTGNWISSKRLTQEWNFLSKQSKKQSDIANARWGNDKKSTTRHAKRMPDRYQIDAPTPTPTPIKEGATLNGKEGRHDMAGNISLDENSEAFKAWEAYNIKTKGRKLPRTTIRPEGAKPFTGWYFPTELPPPLPKRAQAARSLD